MSASNLNIFNKILNCLKIECIFLQKINLQKLIDQQIKNYVWIGGFS